MKALTGMLVTIEEFFAAIKALGLTQSLVPNIYLDRDGLPCTVPDPLEYDFDERKIVFDQFLTKFNRLHS
jgi:hypothetical protein